MPKKILVADPDCGENNSLIHALKARDYEVTRARSVEDAWRILTTEHPHLMIVEPMMPSGTEGFHLVWRIRDFPDRRLSRVPIIMLSKIQRTTGVDLFPNMRDGHYHPSEYLPVQAFLHKPFDETKLLETVDTVLGGEEADNGQDWRAAA